MTDEDSLAETPRVALMRRLRIASKEDPGRCHPACHGLSRAHPEPWCTWYYHGVSGEELRRHSFCVEDAPPLTASEIGAITRRLKVDSFMNAAPSWWVARLLGAAIVALSVAWVILIAIVLLVDP